MCFTDRLYNRIRAQYDADPQGSLIYRIKKAELEAEGSSSVTDNKSGKKKQRYAYHTLYFLELREAFEKASSGNDDDMRRYLEKVTGLLTKKGREQIFIPKDKTELENFCERWNRYLKAFNKNYEDVITGSDSKTRTRVSRAAERMTGLICVGRDAFAEQKIIEKMQEEFTDACVRRASEVYLGIDDDHDHEAKTIDRTILDECEKDGWFAELFSGDGNDDETADDIENDKAMFAAVIRKGMDRNTRGSEECRNLFIPLYVDRLTGVSLVMIGTDYCIDNHDHTVPCGLAVMEADDALMITGRGPGRSFYRAYDDFALKYESAAPDEEKCRRVCYSYFLKRYDDYRVACLRARRLLKETGIGVFSDIPEELKKSRFYAELYKSHEKDEASAQAELDRIGAKITHSARLKKAFR